MSHQWHRRWLKFSACVVGSFGPVFFLGSMLSTREPARFTLDMLSWPIDGTTTFADPDTRFLSALAGGFLCGWAVLIWHLADKVYDIAPELIRRRVLAGFLAWFVVDSAGSVASGNSINVVFNTALLLVGVGPLWWRARDDSAETVGA